MADENNKTEEPTARKLEKLVKKGSLLGLKSSPSRFLTIAVAVLIFIIGEAQ